MTPFARKGIKILIIGFLALLLCALAIGGWYAYAKLVKRTPGEFFEASGVRLHYTDEGRGEPVVLAHGFAVNADLNWRLPGLIDKLTPHYRVIALDLRGHGLSGKPHEAVSYGVEMAQDLVRLLDHLHIEKAHLVGYSLGGFIALKAAVTHPQRWRSIAVLGAGWENPEASGFLRVIGKMKEDLQAGRGIEPQAVSLGGEPPAPTTQHRWWVVAMTRWFNDQQALIAMMDGLPDLAVSEEQLRAIELPVLSMAGGNDPLAKGVEAMVGKIEDHRVIILPGADHLRAVTHPFFAPALLDFLRECCTPESPEEAE